jgi:hypothetical protein
MLQTNVTILVIGVISLMALLVVAVPSTGLSQSQKVNAHTP